MKMSDLYDKLIECKPILASC